MLKIKCTEQSLLKLQQVQLHQFKKWRANILEMVKLVWQTYKYLSKDKSGKQITLKFVDYNVIKLKHSKEKKIIFN